MRYARDSIPGSRRSGRRVRGLTTSTFRMPTSSRRSICTSSSATRRPITRRCSRRCPSATRRLCGRGWKWPVTSSQRTTCAHLPAARCSAGKSTRLCPDTMRWYCRPCRYRRPHLVRPPFAWGRKRSRFGASCCGSPSSSTSLASRPFRCHAAARQAGLPCGLQLVGTRMQTDGLVQVALAVEDVIGGEEPPLSSPRVEDNPIWGY